MGHSGSRHVRLQAQPVKQRGEPTDKEELESWHSKTEFPNLPPRGQEAFFKFLRGGCYSENKDVVDIDISAEGMNNDARRYQFWLKSQGLNLVNLFDLYVNDDETNIPDVRTCYVNYRSKGDGPKLKEPDFLKEKVSDAKKVDDFVGDLKNAMKPDLDQKFTEFKKNLNSKYGERGEKI